MMRTVPVPTTKEVCVIGTGASGLASIKVCLDHGVNVTAYESRDKIAGLWNINSSSSSNTVTNSSSIISSFSDFPVPNDWPLFLPRNLVLQYLNNYAERFHLLNHIQFSTLVRKIIKRPDHKWSVTILDQKSGETSVKVFDAVMICIGHHSEPKIPVVTGSHKYTGKIVHTKYFDASSQDVKGKRVVIIGSGNSAGDAVVTACASGASKVTLAMRSGTHILRRTTIGGKAIDDVALRRSTKFLLKTLIPVRSWRNGLMGWVNKKMHFDPDDWNFPKAKHGILDKQPMINDHILFLLLSGQLEILPIERVDKFTSNSIVFVREKQQMTGIRCDVVIYATGYNNRTDLIRSVVGDQEFLFKKIFASPDSMSLGLIGHVQPLGPMFPLVEMQAKYFLWVQLRSKPINERRFIKSIRDDMKESKRKGNRDALTISWFKYMRSLAEELDLEPPMTRLFFTKPKVWAQLCFNPLTPSQFVRS